MNTRTTLDWIGPDCCIKALSRRRSAASSCGSLQNILRMEPNRVVSMKSGNRFIELDFRDELQWIFTWNDPGCCIAVTGLTVWSVSWFLSDDSANRLMSYSFHSLLFTFSLRLSHFFHCLSFSFTSFTFVHWLSITFTFVTVFTFVHQLKLPSPVSLLVCHLFTSWPPLGRFWSNGIDCFDLSLSLSSTVVQFKFPSLLSPSLTSLTVFHLCHCDLSLWITFCHQSTNFGKAWTYCEVRTLCTPELQQSITLWCGERFLYDMYPNISILSLVKQLWWGVKFTFSTRQSSSKASSSYYDVGSVSFNNIMQTSFCDFLTFSHFRPSANQVFPFEIRIQKWQKWKKWKKWKWMNL